jgi:hypothetical protein
MKQIDIRTQYIMALGKSIENLHKRVKFLEMKILMEDTNGTSKRKTKR